MHLDGAPEALQEAEAEVEGYSPHAAAGTGCGVGRLYRQHDSSFISAHW